jgi:RimJ/RimL family protein N-acetyltransferase
MMTEFRSNAHAFWQNACGLSGHTAQEPEFSIHIADKIPFGYPIMKLHRDDDKIFIIMTPELAKELTISKNSSLQELDQALHDAHMKWYDEDGLYYLSEDNQSRLLQRGDHKGVRELTEVDSKLFSDFEKRNSKQDIDDVEVDLENEAIFGFIHENSLECAGDYYLWSNSNIADIGVLTVPSWRGRGLASKVVESLCRHALAQGRIPQYRCQLDNTASIGVANRLGFQRYGLWTVGVPIEN